jgi:hypothetical protein
LVSIVAIKCSSAGSNLLLSSTAAAIWIADGIESLLLWLMLTWSFACTGKPDACVASRAMTSFAFMFELVPEPVWNTSTGN